MKSMKNLKTIALALLVVAGTITTTAQNKKINVEKSKITWVGKKVTGQHDGTISFNSGTLVFDGKKLKGGSFEVDMTSITVKDLEAGKGKEKLEGHLKADDFFGVDKFSTSILEFKTIASKGSDIYTVTADLTIKGKTLPVTFDLAIGAGSARTAFKVNRTKYGIQYGSGSFFDNLGDKAINDDFELTVSLAY
ncbi:polyisoprenoid-binding protein YceI [Flavobacterium lacus]|jgi:polyisoprenoid-binding protein YceI|uniref:Polyisoprenoid-binding protein YceI n=2 Tax=Flavobacterium lacus TaxID=1353778 RepID=A0A328WR66_9FLAO|nr:polyisoprenoid-binding protein YceI [Flavobacterium lacus]